MLALDAQPPADLNSRRSIALCTRRFKAATLSGCRPNEAEPAFSQSGSNTAVLTVMRVAVITPVMWVTVWSV